MKHIFSDNAVVLLISPAPPPRQKTLLAALVFYSIGHKWPMQM